MVDELDFVLYEFWEFRGEVVKNTGFFCKACRPLLLKRHQDRPHSIHISLHTSSHPNGLS